VRYVTTLRDDVLPGPRVRRIIATWYDAAQCDGHARGAGRHTGNLCRLSPGASDEVTMSMMLACAAARERCVCQPTVFTDLDLCLTPGQFAALVGPTGGGKSPC